MTELLVAAGSAVNVGAYVALFWGTVGVFLMWWLMGDYSNE